MGLSSTVPAALPIPSLPAGCGDSPGASSVEVTDPAALEALRDRSPVEDAEEGQFLYARAFCGVAAGGLELYVVRSVGSSPPTGITLRYVEANGFLVNGNSSQGLAPPLFSSATGHSAVGKFIFTSNLFVYASTTVESATSVVLSTGGRQEEVPLVTPGVADLTAAWADLSEPEGSFTVAWFDGDGTVVDELQDRFIGQIH